MRKEWDESEQRTVVECTVKELRSWVERYFRGRGQELNPPWDLAVEREGSPYLIKLLEVTDGKDE